MAVASPDSRLSVHGFRGMNGAFPSFCGRNRAVRVFRVPKIVFDIEPADADYLVKK